VLIGCCIAFCKILFDVCRIYLDENTEMFKSKKVLPSSYFARPPMPAKITWLLLWCEGVLCLVLLRA
jgi:hypothetical protein